MKEKKKNTNHINPSCENRVCQSKSGRPCGRRTCSRVSRQGVGITTGSALRQDLKHVPGPGEWGTRQERPLKEGGLHTGWEPVRNDCLPRRSCLKQPGFPDANHTSCHHHITGIFLLKTQGPASLLGPLGIWGSTYTCILSPESPCPQLTPTHTHQCVHTFWDTLIKQKGTSPSPASNSDSVASFSLPLKVRSRKDLTGDPQTFSEEIESWSGPGLKKEVLRSFRLDRRAP